jgi:signal transduction histidine kinase
MDPMASPARHAAPGRATLLVIGAATAGCVAVAARLQQVSDRPARGADYWVELMVGVSCVAAGAVVWRRSGVIGSRLALAGFLTFASALLRSNDSWLFTIGNAVEGLGVIVLAHVIVTYPSGRAETLLERTVVGSIYVGGGLVLLARATTTDFATSCRGLCPPNRFYVGGYPGLFHGLDRASVVVIAALNVGAAFALVSKWRRASRARRRILTYPYAALALLFPMALVVHSGFDNRGPSTTASAVFDAMVLLFPISLAAGLLRGRLARSAASDLLVELDRETDLGAAARRALGDPSARLLRWDHGHFVDTDGHDAGEPGALRRRSVVERDGAPLAAIDHDDALADEPERLRAVLAAVGLAVDRSRLADAVHLQLDEVAASRARIVSAADAERRRIQRDLHDGAQQRLVGVSIAVRRARTRALRHGEEELADLLAQAASDVDTSLAEIRSLAAGLRPPLLDEHGLLAALDSLAEGALVPTTVDGHVDGTLAPTTESAAFFVASECLANTIKHAAATSVRITVHDADDTLVLTVADDGQGGATITDGRGLRGLQDRVEALRGSLDVHSTHEDGTTITVALPIR